MHVITLFCTVVENVYLCFDITLKFEIDNLVFISVDMGDALFRSIFSSSSLANVMSVFDEDDDYWDQLFVMLFDQDYLTFFNTLHKRQC